MPIVASVNIGKPKPNPYKDAEFTGIGKLPVVGPVDVRAPGPKDGGLGSGLVGDFIGDRANHSGDDQAVYAFTLEDLDWWERRLNRELPNGFFGENLTTRGVDVNEARLGERWLIGAPSGPRVELQVTGPRIPCATFRGWVGEKRWLRTFTEVARPGAYLKVITPGVVSADDPIVVTHRPGHDVTVSLVYRATTTERDLLPRLLAAGDDLGDELCEIVARRGGFDLF